MRYTCICDPSILYNELLRYKNQVLLELPESRERSRRLAAGLSSQVCIDPCIEDVIKYLWDKGIETLGCCCGHNVINGYVDVHPDCWAQMEALGYKKMPPTSEGIGEWSFYLM